MSSPEHKLLHSSLQVPMVFMSAWVQVLFASHKRLWLLCQGTSETRDVLHPSTHRTLMYLQNGHSRGYIPAGCLSRNEKKAVFSLCFSPAIYNGQVTWRKELNKEKVVTHYYQ